MNAYIIAGFRSAVGKSGRGKFRFTRPDDLAAGVVKHLVASVPNLDIERIDDVIVGNATPEAEQGLNIGRMISLMGLDTDKVPGMTVNRYCSSGSETIAIAAAKIHSGQADCIIAGGVECMSPIPFGGWRIVPNAKVGKANPTWYWGMGLTAEAVARDFKVSREDQDAFALASNEKALAAIAAGRFKDDIVPIEVERVYLDAKEKRQVEKSIVDTDEGPRASTLEALAKLKPVFDARGTVTAGNASQTSDGAAFLMVVSERMLKELKREAHRTPPLLPRGRRGAAHHGHRSGGGSAQGRGNGRPEAEGHRAVRAERSLRITVAGGDPRTGSGPQHRERERRRHRAWATPWVAAARN
jgi:acetyl-CoA acyltransferase